MIETTLATAGLLPDYQYIHPIHSINTLIMFAPEHSGGQRRSGLAAMACDCGTYGIDPLAATSVTMDIEDVAATRRRQRWMCGCWLAAAGSSGLDGELASPRFRG